MVGWIEGSVRVGAWHLLTKRPFTQWTWILGVPVDSLGVAVSVDSLGVAVSVDSLGVAVSYGPSKRTPERANPPFLQPEFSERLSKER